MFDNTETLILFCQGTSAGFFKSKWKSGSLIHNY